MSRNPVKGVRAQSDLRNLKMTRPIATLTPECRELIGDFVPGADPETKPTPLSARLFRALFRKSRPRGYMRVGTWMARACSSMQNVEVPLGNGSSLFLDLRKIDHQPIFLDGRITFEAEERNSLSYFVRSGGIAVDVGANLGIYTVTLASLVGPRGLVLAYEPRPEDVRANTSKLPQVIVRPFAVSDEEGELPFREERSTALSRTVSTNEAVMSNLRVASVTLDAEVSRLRINSVDFLKIDIEGAEDRALLGASRLLSGSSPPIVMFEWIPAFQARWTYGAFGVLRNIIGDDWRMFRVGWGRPTTEIIEFKEPLENANILAFPPGRGEALSLFLNR